MQSVCGCTVLFFCFCCRLAMLRARNSTERYVICRENSINTVNGCNIVNAAGNKVTQFIVNAAATAAAAAAAVDVTDCDSHAFTIL